MKHPYHNIREDEDNDLERETHRRQARREVIQAKKFIGSGEDADIYHQLNPFNANAVNQEPQA